MYCNWMDGNYESYVSLITQELKNGSFVKMIALGTSMEPAIKNYQELLISPHINDIKIGDIVFAKINDNVKFIHRICSIYKDFYILKGDNSFEEDFPVHNTEIIGIVIEEGLCQINQN